jgi:hypothetical protein
MLNVQFPTRLKIYHCSLNIQHSQLPLRDYPTMQIFSGATSDNPLRRSGKDGIPQCAVLFERPIIRRMAFTASFVAEARTNSLMRENRVIIYQHPH